jgi:Flp pilus assembly pilin Flp
MIKNFGAFLNDESGSAAVEYGVFAAGISASILMAIKEIGPNSTGFFLHPGSFARNCRVWTLSPFEISN